MSLEPNLQSSPLQVETEDMIAKMKAETGMGMKMYKREAGGLGRGGGV